MVQHGEFQWCAFESDGVDSEVAAVKLCFPCVCCKANSYRSLNRLRRDIGLECRIVMKHIQPRGIDVCSLTHQNCRDAQSETQPSLFCHTLSLLDRTRDEPQGCFSFDRSIAYRATRLSRPLYWPDSTRRLSYQHELCLG